MNLGNHSQLCQKLDAMLLDALHGNIVCEYLGVGNDFIMLSLLSDDGMVNLTYDESHYCKIMQVEITPKGETFILDGGYCGFVRPVQKTETEESFMRRLQVSQKKCELMERENNKMKKEIAKYEHEHDHFMTLLEAFFGTSLADKYRNNHKKE